MNKTEFQKLLRLRKQMAGKATYPFVPFVGSSYRKNSRSPRLMIVGKATEGPWRRKGGTYEDQERKAQDFCLNGMLGYYERRSSFWRFVLDLAEELLDKKRTSDRSHREVCGLMNRVIWNNLMKLGAEKGPPSGELARSQSDLTKEILKRELKKWRPTVVVLTTGDDYYNEVECLFGPRAAWDTSHGRFFWILKKKCPFSGGWVYWTRHPQFWSAKPRNAAIEKIVADNT